MGEWTGGHMMECPAIAELKSALLAGVPLLAAQPAKIGMTRPDGSRHDAGLAMDIMLHSQNMVEKLVADRIIEAIIKLHPKMKWSDILYTDWNGSSPVFFHIPGAWPFSGPKGMLKKNPNTNKKLGEEHINHIHIDWWTGDPKKLPASSNSRGFKTGLVAELLAPPQWLVDYMKTIT